MILNRDFAAMLRNEPNCFTFTIENTTMLCKGHPKWDPKTPGKNVEVRALQIATKDEWSSAETFCKTHLKQSKNGTIITKISEKQRKERWLKCGMILSVQNCEIKKHQRFIGNEYWVFILKSEFCYRSKTFSDLKLCHAHQSCLNLKNM